MGNVTFSAFSDIHYYPGVFMSNSPERLKKIHQRAVDNNVDFVIELGDMCHDPKNCREFIDQYKNWEMPTYFALGNHDQDLGSGEDAVEAYGMPSNYYFFEKGGYRFIVLDPNYVYYDGKYFHYSHKNYFQYNHTDPHHPEQERYNCNLPPEELEWLEKTIMESEYPCVLMSHESLEREYDGIVNLEQFRALIRRVNKDKKRVFLCINGDTHVDFLRLYEGVYYFALNSSSIDWIGGKGHNAFPKEMMDAYSDLKYTIMFEEPVHAIITLKDNEIFIKGMESGYYMGIDRETLGVERFDGSRRLRTPNVLTAHITWDKEPLDYYFR